MKKKNTVTMDEKLKYEIAQELGLYDRVVRDGWKSLSARETGKIGGMMTQKKREGLKQREEERKNEGINKG